MQKRILHAPDCMAKKYPDFEPSAGFRWLYLGACELAVNTQPGTRQLLSTFISLTSQMSDTGWAGVELHKSLLQAHRQIPVEMTSRSFCLCCPSRSPRSGLPRCHITCERCFQISGKRISPEQYIYSMLICPLCGEEIGSFRIHMKHRLPEFAY